MISQKAKEIVVEVKELESWFDEKLKFHTKREFLSVISCDGFLYGIFILFVGALQKKTNVECNGIIEILLLFVCVALLHCTIYEKINVRCKIGRLFEPSIALHITLFILCIVIGIVFCSDTLLGINSGWLAIMSVIACFSGFIAYFCMVLVSSLILLFIMLYKIFRLDMKSEIQRQSDDIDRYKEELNAIDAEIKNENLADQFELSGGEGITEA